MIIANNGFQDYEFGIPFDIFNENDCEVTIAAWNKWDCIWVFGSKTIADLDLKSVNTKDRDIVVFVGWWWAYTQYFKNSEYLKIAKEAKKIWAICITPMIISDTGIFNGKNVTGWDQNWVQKKYIQDNGWFWVDKDVVVSGNIVTANWPEAAKEFAEKCLEIVHS